MKTPRQILLQRHEAATPKLDAVRETALAGISSRTATEPLLVRDSFFITLWRELFWSCRRVWGGLAAIWLAVVVINTAIDDSPRVSIASAPQQSHDWKLALQAQREMVRQLLKQDAPPVAVAPDRRSDRRNTPVIG